MFNGYKENNSCCYFHSREVVVGVCHLCLNERLLILAAEQGHHQHHQYLPSSRTATTLRSEDTSLKKLSPINLPKIFALGSFLNRLEFRRGKQSDKLSDVSTSSEEESFISIKIEDNGAASWEKGNGSVVEKQCKKRPSMNQNQSMAKETMGVIEHAKPHGAGLRWQNRIGHIFQVMKLKRSTNKGNTCHVESKVDAVNERMKGWVKRSSQTKRRTQRMNENSNRKGHDY